VVVVAEVGVADDEEVVEALLEEEELLPLLLLAVVPAPTGVFTHLMLKFTDEFVVEKFTCCISGRL
jgi:hypothetical protein